MEWFLKLAHERAEAERKKKAVIDGGKLFWTVLKSRVREAQTAYNTRYAAIATYPKTAWDETTTPGQPFLKREIQVGATLQEKDRVTLQYHPPATITATYSPDVSTVVLTVSLGAAGDAILQCGGNEITVDGACELILRPILFDDLPKV
jgi:hypothetical protein